MSAFELPYSIKVTNPFPVDYLSGPYIGVDVSSAKELANSGITQSLRFKSLEVRLIVAGSSKKFWYRDGIEDTDLVEFVSGDGFATSSFYIQGGTTSSYDTTSDIYRTGSIAIGTSTSSGVKLYVYATQSGAFQLKDGTEGPGYVLTSDLNGISSWTNSYLTIASASSTYYSLTNPAAYITSSTLIPYLTSASASSTYYSLTNPAAYITSSALIPYLTSASASSTFYIQGGSTYSFDTTSAIYRTGLLKIGYGTASSVLGIGGNFVTQSYRFVVSSLVGGTVSLVVDETGAVYNRSKGTSNTLFGLASLYSNTTGSINTAIGNSALFSNTTGNYNVGVGSSSLYSNLNGQYNIAIGIGPLFNNLSGNYNIALGRDSLIVNTTGTDNIGIGYNTLFNNNSNYNIALGSNALYGVTTGGYNIGIGNNTSLQFHTNTNSIVIGASAIGFGSNSVTLGNDLITTTILRGNVGIGSVSPSSKLHIYSTTSGAFRLEDGTQGPGYVLTSNANGVASWTASSIGISGSGTINYLPKFTTSTSLSNSTITDTGSIVTINSKLIIDSSLGVYTTKTGWDTYSTGFGYQALNSSTGVRNTAFGYRASSGNIIGDYNSSFGQFALFSSTQSTDNTAIGSGALSWITTGNYNTAIGRNAGAGSTTFFTNISDSIFIGYLTTPFNNGETNQIVIGNSQAGNGSNSVTLGNIFINKTILRGNVGIGLTGPSTKLHIYATQSGAFRLEDGTQSYPGYVLTSDANGVGTWQGNTQVTLNGPTATALATWNNTTVMSIYSATCSITIPDTGLPPNFSFRFIIIAGNSGSVISFTYSSPVSILPNTLLTFAQYESGVIDRYGTGQNYYITY